MLNLPGKEGSFYGADQVCDPLIPPDSPSQRFRELVVPLIKDDKFESMYYKDNGRPCIPPLLLDLATFPVNIGDDLLDSKYYKESTFYNGPPRLFWDDGFWAR